MHTPEPSVSPPGNRCDDCESYSEKVCESGYCVLEERERMAQESYEDQEYNWSQEDTA